ncbi:MAG: thermonuclease family protein [Alphaproteobacteria bacterium]|nr:thermonuclease family protein [Alphaproteobacteria bacterium]MCB9690761.1 thermonuclease family protein [Alphaproteobacteria bacterium]
MILALGLACVDRPPLDLVDRVPIVASDRCDEPREAFVGCVLSGDTFELGACGSGDVMRLVGVEAPEPDACWGPEAREALEREIRGRTVLLTFDRRCEDGGEGLAYVWDPDEPGISLGVLLVEAGDAHARQEAFGEVLLRAELEAAEDRARARGVGLWGACPGE